MQCLPKTLTNIQDREFTTFLDDLLVLKQECQECSKKYAAVIVFVVTISYWFFCCCCCYCTIQLLHTGLDESIQTKKIRIRNLREGTLRTVCEHNHRLRNYQTDRSFIMLRDNFHCQQPAFLCFQNHVLNVPCN